MLSFDYDSEVNYVTNEIIKKLKENSYMNSILVFNKLIDDLLIEEMYSESQFYSSRNYINRHDRLHALQVTLFSLKLFNLMKDENSLRLFSSRARPQYGFSTMARCHIDRNINQQMAEDLTCIILIYSSYCHDIFKFLGGVHNVAAAIFVANIVQNILPSIITPKTHNVGYEMLLTSIQKCIAKHDGDANADCAEEGIIMLSDTCDNDEYRIISSPPEEVIVNDRKPIEYFSCKNIDHPIKVIQGTEKKINIEISLKGDAGFHHVHEMYSVILKSKLENLVSLRVHHLDFDDVIQII